MKEHQMFPFAETFYSLIGYSIYCAAWVPLFDFLLRLFQLRLTPLAKDVLLSCIEAIYFCCILFISNNCPLSWFSTTLGRKDYHLKSSSIFSCPDFQANILKHFYPLLLFKATSRVEIQDIVFFL